MVVYSTLFVEFGQVEKGVREFRARAHTSPRPVFTCPQPVHIM